MTLYIGYYLFCSKQCKDGILTLVLNKSLGLNCSNNFLWTIQQIDTFEAFKMMSIYQMLYLLKYYC